MYDENLTVGDVVGTMDEKQRYCLYYHVASALDSGIVRLDLDFKDVYDTMSDIQKKIMITLCEKAVKEHK